MKAAIRYRIRVKLEVRDLWFNDITTKRSMDFHNNSLPLINHVVLKIIDVLFKDCLFKDTKK